MTRTSHRLVTNLSSAALRVWVHTKSIRVIRKRNTATGEVAVFMRATQPQARTSAGDHIWSGHILCKVNRAELKDFPAALFVNACWVRGKIRQVLHYAASWCMKGFFLNASSSGEEWKYIYIYMNMNNCHSKFQQKGSGVKSEGCLLTEINVSPLPAAGEKKRWALLPTGNTHTNKAAHLPWPDLHIK